MRIGLLVKSHSPDLVYTSRLMASLARFNTDHLPVFLVVPDEDVPAFTTVASGVAELVPESRFGEHLVTEAVNGYSAGYINQEIVKLCFWEAVDLDAYLCLDSDAELVAPLTREHLVSPDGTPYTFLTEDRDLQSDPGYYAAYWVPRMAALERIAEAIGWHERPLRTVHGHALFARRALESFRQDFLAPRGWGYADALRLAPFEPTWYSLWVQHARPIPVIPREPIVKTFHTHRDFLDYRLRGLGPTEAGRGYPIVVVNSNFSRGDGVLDLSDPPALSLARFESLTSLASGLVQRFRR